MLNITLQCCGLVMLIILFFIFLEGRGLALSSRRNYFIALVSCIVALSLDILSIIGIWQAQCGAFPDWAAKSVCKLYVMSLAFESYQGFFYAASQFFSVNSHRALKRVYEIFFAAGIILIGVLPLHYYMKGRVVYSYGPSTIVTYVVCIVFIASALVVAFLRSEQSSGRRRMAILLWQGAWLLAALIQLLNPELLLVSYAGMFGMFVLYAELENPHEGIDRVTGIYTSNALIDYINDSYQHGRSFAMFYIRLEYSSTNVDFETERTILIRLTNFLKEGARSYIFRDSDTEFVVIYPHKGAMDEDVQRIMVGLPDAIGLPIGLRYILIPDSSLSRSAEEFFRLQHHVLSQFNDREYVVIDETAVDEIREYARVKEMIQSALSEERVEVFYQPFFNVRENRFTSAEALVRIRNRDGSLVPPGVFIPIAEENGLIIPLGEEIFRQVCAFLASGRPQELGIDRIEVNLSVAQFDQDDLAESMLSVMHRYGVDPNHLNLEITETASPVAKQVLLRNMRRLMSQGVRFSLDDFGTGRSNLDYFVEMPVDIIKFDYGFTQSYFRSEKAKNVLESVIAMMHRMNLEIVSEGVETEEQLQAMKSLGVEYIQGYYFSRPVPKDEFLAFLRTEAMHR